MTAEYDFTPLSIAIPPPHRPLAIPSSHIPSPLTTLPDLSSPDFASLVAALQSAGPALWDSWWTSWQLWHAPRDRILSRVRDAVRVLVGNAPEFELRDVSEELNAGARVAGREFMGRWRGDGTWNPGPENCVWVPLRGEEGRDSQRRRLLMEEVDYYGGDELGKDLDPLAGLVNVSLSRSGKNERSGEGY